MAREVPLLAPGSRLQQLYVVEKLLGQGGMGAVYLARVGDSEDRVAIKEMRVGSVSRAQRQQAVLEFRQEAATLAELKHPGLVRVLDVFEERGQQYLVMEYVEGVTLEMELSRHGRATAGQALEWAEQLCDVLHHLHTQEPPIIFRDLKPPNIILDSDGSLALIDFGIARPFEPEIHRMECGVGTPGYAPPEQYDGVTDGRTDVYALGATLYSLLTCAIPPPAPDRRQGVELKPPSEVTPEVPPELSAIVMRMMALDRDRRYPTVARAWEDLKALRRDLETAEYRRLDSNSGALYRCIKCRQEVIPTATTCPHCGAVLRRSVRRMRQRRRIPVIPPRQKRAAPWWSKLHTGTAAPLTVWSLELLGLLMVLAGAVPGMLRSYGLFDALASLLRQALAPWPPLGWVLPLALPVGLAWYAAGRRQRYWMTAALCWLGGYLANPQSLRLPPADKLLLRLVHYLVPLHAAFAGAMIAGILFMLYRLFTTGPWNK
ncbi:MAG: serine/threonine protein kinase [Candidatus Xenobia bacterium]